MIKDLPPPPPVPKEIPDPLEYNGLRDFRANLTQACNHVDHGGEVFVYRMDQGRHVRATYKLIEVVAPNDK